MMQQGPAAGMRFGGMQHAGMVQGGGGGAGGGRGGMMPGRGGMQMGGMAGMQHGGGGGGGHQAHGMGQQMMGMNAKPQQVGSVFFSFFLILFVRAPACVRVCVCAFGSATNVSSVCCR